MIKTRLGQWSKGMTPLALNGVGYMYASDSGMPTGTNARAFSAWFKTTATITGGQYRWVTVYGGAAIYQAPGNATYNGSCFHMGFAGGPNSFGLYTYGDSLTTAGCNDGNWHHAVVQYSGGTADLYVDGTLAGSKSMTLNTLSMTWLYVGAWDAGDILTANVADVRAFNKVLVADEVKHLYNGGRAPATNRLSGCIRHYPFNGDGTEKTGIGNTMSAWNWTAAYSASGNGPG